jgi:hypothetical protein
LDSFLTRLKCKELNIPYELVLAYSDHVRLESEDKEKKTDVRVTEILNRFPKVKKSDPSLPDELKLNEKYSLPSKLRLVTKNRKYGTVNGFYNRTKRPNAPGLIIFDLLRENKLTWSQLAKILLTRRTNIEEAFAELLKYYKGTYSKFGWIGRWLTNEYNEDVLWIEPTSEWDGQNIPEGGIEEVES